MIVKKYFRLNISCKSLLFPLMLALTACMTNPSTISLPDEKKLNAQKIELLDINQLPPVSTIAMVGDTLRIVRDAQELITRDETSLYVIRSDGSFAYPNAGIITAAGKTPEEIALLISQKLEKIYRLPEVTVNIVISPGNKVFVGGAVRNPSAFDVSSIANVQQLLLAAGGVLPTADSHHVALLRTDNTGKYQVYFFDYSQLLNPSSNTQVALQRGDVIFVPKSGIGNAVEGVDLYLNQLIPFTKSIGIGFSYYKQQP